MRRIKITRVCLFTLIFFCVLLCFSSSPAAATPEFAEETEKTCTFCHEGPNGGVLNNAGIGFIRNGYEYPVPKRILEKSAVLTGGFHRTLRMILGYIHLVTAVVFAGTIFFIHIFIKPRSLKTGIPGGEKRLGLTCMSILLSTGIYLTWYRLDTAGAFFESRFGLLLFIKIALFAVLLALGILAVTLVNRKMKQAAAGGGPDTAGPEAFDISRLSRYDGQEGRPAYVVYKGDVYDVSGSPKWKNGSHFAQHGAGKDLTGALANAPHGDNVFEGFPVIAQVSEEGTKAASGKAPKILRVFTVMAYVNLGLVFLILFCVAGWKWLAPGTDIKRVGKSFRTEAAGIVTLSAGESACIECHQAEKPALTADWEKSVHAKIGVSCLDCHEVHDPKTGWTSTAHFEYSEVPVSPLVTPDRCAMCHQKEVDEYSRSKHANTITIINTVDNWLIHGMNNAAERTTGCYACHGTKIEIIDGRPSEGSWPNVGVGRVNPDGSLGSCTSCHTRHRFSVVEARKPEACDQCHLGPDHPQIEIYNESKHGTMYHAYGDEWTWRPEDFHWTAGRDYRAPTCAACHMSEAGDLAASHDVTNRLSWELQAPLTIRPSEFAPFPSGTTWKEERAKMETVCLQCHSEGWTEGHFTNMDTVVERYNELYYKPIKEKMDLLYEEGKLSRDSYFDEELEWEYYELWHHEGRRARMGAAMMAPDYAWWHGFYELKHRFAVISEMIETQTKDGRGEWIKLIPGQYGKTAGPD